MSKTFLAALGLCGLAACTMDNPIFDEDQAGSETRGGDGDGDPETSTGDGDGDPETSTGDGDGDPETSTGDGDGDTGEPPVCEQARRPPLHLAVQPPGECANAYSELFLKLDPTTFNAQTGTATGPKCTDYTCAECPYPDYSVGVPGFEGLASVWTVLAGILDGENIPLLCVQVATEGYLGVIDGACAYDSMAIMSHNLENGPLFIASNEASVPGIVANYPLFIEGPPMPLDSPFATCACESVVSDANDLECCEGSELEPSFYKLDFHGVKLSPGESAPVPVLPNLFTPWDFHVHQAQSLPGCGNIPGEVDTSWALVRPY